MVEFMFALILFIIGSISVVCVLLSGGREIKLNRKIESGKPIQVNGSFFRCSAIKDFGVDSRKIGKTK